MSFLRKGVALAILIMCGIAAPLAAAATAESASPPSRCGALPPLPSLPDGATADRKAMLAAHEAVNSWNKAVQAILDCRTAEIQELQAREQALTNEYNAAVKAADALKTSYETEAAKFNAR